MSDAIKSLDAYVITIPRDTPYLGALREGEQANAQRYFVRAGNRTVYALEDRNVVVRVETVNGAVGWGETYGLVAPRATIALIEDLLAAFVIGRDPFDAALVHQDLYDLQRVRGYAGGYYHDALAAINIALYDVAGKIAGLPIAKLLGGSRSSALPAYVSGLPKSTRRERADLAVQWMERGFSDFKFAAPVADDGVVAEIETLRQALGPQARIACDMHWAHSADAAAALIHAMQPYGLWFAEAPVAPEDIDGLAQLARSLETPIAAGEEWRTAHDAALRISRRALGIVQPEMAHTGITEFMRIGQLAAASHLQVIPHATIGIGLFLAASLQASAALNAVVGHEFQHSVFEPNRRLITGGMDCRDGAYVTPSGPGLGVEPSQDALRLLKKL